MSEQIISARSQHYLGGIHPVVAGASHLVAGIEGRCALGHRLSSARANTLTYAHFTRLCSSRAAWYPGSSRPRRLLGELCAPCTSTQHPSQRPQSKAGSGISLFFVCCVCARYWTTRANYISAFSRDICTAHLFLSPCLIKRCPPEAYHGPLVENIEAPAARSCLEGRTGRISRHVDSNEAYVVLPYFDVG